MGSAASDEIGDETACWAGCATDCAGDDESSSSSN